MYIEFLDKKADPYKAADRTINCLFKLADEFNCDVQDIFEHLNANDVIQLLHRRQLSPWILIHSPKFKQFLINKTTKDQRIVMQTIIRPDYWAEKKSKLPEVVIQMKRYVSELDL